MKKIFISLAVAACAITTVTAKKQLDHSAFDSWEKIKVYSLSNDGAWASYAVNPQEGDGHLYLRNTKSGKVIDLPRGYNPIYTADSKWAVALIKPEFAATRKAKIDKKKDFDLPQDSMAIVNLRTGAVEKVARVSGFKVGKEGGDWIAWLSSDTTYITPKNLKDNKAGKPLVIKNLNTGIKKVLPWVNDYTFSDDGQKLAASTMPAKSDSLAVSRMVLFNLPDTTEISLLDSQKFFGAPVFDDASSQFAFTASLDSADTGTKRAKLYRGKVGVNARAEEMYLLPTANAGKTARIMPPRITDESKRDSIMASVRQSVTRLAGDSLFVNQYSVPAFSHNGRRLVVGVAREIAPDDTTIVDFEQAKLDIWRWDAPMTPPQEQANIKSIRKHTYPLVVNLESGKEVLTTSSDLEMVVPGDRWDADWALVRDQSKEAVSQQWNYSAPEDLYIINLNTGEKRLVTTVAIDLSDISPAGKYVWWYDDRNYYTYNISTGVTQCVTKDIDVPLWNESQDTPMPRRPCGVMGWADNDEAFFIYDKYDIWKIDPDNKFKPVNFTKNAGRAANRRYRYVKTDPDKRSFSRTDEVLLSVLDFATKENGYATIKTGSPAVPDLRIINKYKFTQLKKALDAPVYAYQKANFSTAPDVWIAVNNNFAKAVKVTSSNPQMADYSWGTAELVKWYSYNGKPIEGVLYTPEDLDVNKKYPMLVVFYEQNADDLYLHYDMEPSWSWINYPFYVSRGYVVFVPDVHYTPGLPGESAYDCICSGVEDLCKKYPWIDKEHIGIDGQSWGGYQTAFLITRTNMFACAGSGAPVSNMTSAFGGIRWGTGDSRQAQYECGQSRIGRNLWEAPELYIANSPLFYADRVNTPLLIMHNDEDGAVPWYQGIEYFMALRRLGKPVWMLQYNGEAHNLMQRKNRKDITIRLQQFFDHYLKGAPMPEWMKTGIPILRKGQEMRTGLLEE